VYEQLLLRIKSEYERELNEIRGGKLTGLSNRNGESPSVSPIREAPFLPPRQNPINNKQARIVEVV
jgi:hypothetical protein